MAAKDLYPDNDIAWENTDWVQYLTWKRLKESATRSGKRVLSTPSPSTKVTRIFKTPSGKITKMNIRPGVARESANKGMQVNKGTIISPASGGDQTVTADQTNTPIYDTNTMIQDNTPEQPASSGDQTVTADQTNTPIYDTNTMIQDNTPEQPASGGDQTATIDGSENISSQSKSTDTTVASSEKPTLPGNDTTPSEDNNENHIGSGSDEEVLEEDKGGTQKSSGTSNVVSTSTKTSGSKSGSAYIDSEELKTIASDMKTKINNIMENYQNQASSAITLGQEAIQISGLDITQINDSFNKIFTNLSTRINSLADFLVNNVANEYDETSVSIINTFNNDFASSLSNLLGIK